MNKAKKFGCLLLLVVVLCPIIAIAWDYSGTGSGGPGASGTGNWHPWVFGIRVTAVDKNGKRLTIQADGTTYTSRSIDYYGNVLSGASGSNEHSVCGGRLCSKPELESGGFNSNSGGYQYEQWPYQGISGFALPTGSIDNPSAVSQLVRSTKNFENREDLANDLFQRLMGQSITYFQNNTTGDCEELKDKLTEAFIIFEPVSEMGSFSGTASEIAIMYHNNENQKYGTVPKLYNALRVDPAVGNRGLVYFNGVGAMPTYASSTLNYTQAAINDTHQGYGVAILAYGPEFVKDSSTWLCDYDYSYTASCATCENTNSEYLAYTIKDTTDWGGIMNSGSSSNANVKDYFHQGEYASGDSQDPQGDVYCREEFEVYFPNALSQIYVDPGRYFIMYPDDTSGLSTTGSPAVPNLKPYKVYRKRECKAEVNLWQKEKESYSAFLARVQRAKKRTLSNYEKAKKQDFVDDMGKVWFRYNETYEKSKYNMDDPDQLDRYQIYIDNPFTDYEQEVKPIGSDDAKLTMENTNKYELPDDYYNYIRLRDGLSMMKAPTEPYITIDIGNLPVSYENHGVKISETQYKVADIQFAYDLPANALLSKAASEDGYLATSLGNGGTGGDCISKETIMGEPTSGYSCKVLTATIPDGDPGGGCKSEDDANKLGVDWNPKGGYCCPVGKVYNSETGTCDPGPNTGDDCKTEADANKMGVDWNPMTNSCCPVGTKYSSRTGRCEDVPDDSECKTEEDADRLGLDWNSKGKYCCPAGTKYNNITGTCDPEPDTGDDCKTEADANRLGVDWNPKGKYCCPVGTKYDSSTGKCENEPGNPPGTGNGCKTEADANRLGVDWNPMTKSCCTEGSTYDPNTGTCAGGNEEDPVCPTSQCPYGCCPSGECAPMPDGTCPGFGAIDVIYRTIDLEDPFPGQSASNRETGSNWCSYNISTKAIDCNYNNQTPINFITRERSNKKNGYKVYDDDHVLYEVSLDSRTISSIRSYNNKNKYDNDWIDQCYDNGKACKSKFLKEYSSVITGKCKSTSKSNFYTCDKDV